MASEAPGGLYSAVQIGQYTQARAQLFDYAVGSPLPGGNRCATEAHTNMRVAGCLPAGWTMHVTRLRARITGAVTESVQALLSETRINFKVGEKLEVESTVDALLHGAVTVDTAIPQRCNISVGVDFDRELLKEAVKSLVVPNYEPNEHIKNACDELARLVALSPLGLFHNSKIARLHANIEHELMLAVVPTFSYRYAMLWVELHGDIRKPLY